MDTVGVEDLLQTAGFKNLGTDPAPEAIDAALRRLAMAAGTDPIRRQTLRHAAIPYLAEAGVQAPAKMIDAALFSRAARPEPATPAPLSDPNELEEAGRPILDAPDQLALVRTCLRKAGYAGDTAAAELIYLVLHSRTSARPINAAITGPSASGKSHTVDAALELHAAEAVYRLTSSSERTLIYTDTEFAGRYIVIAEAAGLARDGVGATIMRELAWGGRGIRYETVEKGEDGKLVARMIEKAGPTGLLTTTTRKLDPELATRLLRVTISDSAAQTRAVLRSVAARAARGNPAKQDTSEWHAASRWLAQAGEQRVLVPFAEPLAEHLPDDDVRLRRDVEQILGLVRVHAFCHQRHRERTTEGVVLADQRDYAAAYRLLRSVMAITLDAGASPAVRETVEAVVDLLDGAGDTSSVSNAQLQGRLGLAKSTISARVAGAVDAGYLVNLEQRRGHAAKLRSGDPLPAARPILPEPVVLFEGGVAETPPDLPEHPNTQAQVVTAQGDKPFGYPSERYPNTRTVPNTLSERSNGNDDSELAAGVRVFGSESGGTGEGVPEQPMDGSQASLSLSTGRSALVTRAEHIEDL